MEKAKFKVSNRKLTSGLGSAFAVFFILGYISTKVSPDFMKYLPFIIALAIVIGIVVGIIVKEYYLKITNTGFEIIKGKAVTTYEFSDYLGSNVVKHYTNGIYVGTTREIKIKDKNDKTKNINCSRLNRHKFSDLVSYLSKYEIKSTHNEDSVAEYFNQERVFNVPSDELIKNYKKKAIIYAILSIIFLIPAIVFISIYSNGNHDSLPIIAMVLTSLGAGYCLIETVIKWISYNDIRTIPDHIKLDSLMITVGKDSYVINDISYISMVPGNYNILTRDLIIKTKDGKKHKYNFGKNIASKKYNYSDYEELFKTTQLYCINKNINFISNLG